MFSLLWYLDPVILLVCNAAVYPLENDHAVLAGFLLKQDSVTGQSIAGMFNICVSVTTVTMQFED